MAELTYVFLYECVRIGVYLHGKIYHLFNNVYQTCFVHELFIELQLKFFIENRKH